MTTLVLSILNGSSSFLHTIRTTIKARMRLNFVKIPSPIYPLTKSEGYSFGVVRPPVRSVRPHFLFVRNHISVPIGQI